MDTIKFRFTNWPEYQGESSRYQSTSWLRMQNTAWMSPIWDALNDSEWRAFTFLLMYVSQKAHSSGEVEISLPTITRMSGIAGEVIVSALEKLGALRVIEAIPGECTVSAPCEPREQTGNTRATKITKITKSNAHSLSAACAADLNFQEVYSKYPKKKGKLTGYKVFRGEIKTPEDYQSLLTALEKFRAWHARNKTDQQFIPHFSTFMGIWRECLDDDWGVDAVGCDAQKVEWDEPA